MTEGGELIDFYDGRELIVNEADRHAVRYIGMEFESEEAAIAYYDAYAKCVGFIIRVGNCHHSSRDGSIVSRRFLCNKEGFRVNNKKMKRLEVRKPREGCKAMIMVRKEASGKWIVTKLETSHSHPLGIPAGKVVKLLFRPDHRLVLQFENFFTQICYTLREVVNHVHIVSINARKSVFLCLNVS